MNGSIFIRGAVQGKPRGGVVFLMSACGSGGVVANPFLWEKKKRSATFTLLSLMYANMPLLTFFIISHSLLHLHSTSGVSHEKPELQFDIPPAEGVNTAGLHPAGI